MSREADPSAYWRCESDAEDLGAADQRKEQGGRYSCIGKRSRPEAARGCRKTAVPGQWFLPEQPMTFSLTVRGRRRKRRARQPHLHRADCGGLGDDRFPFGQGDIGSAAHQADHLTQHKQGKETPQKEVPSRSRNDDRHCWPQPMRPLYPSRPERSNAAARLGPGLATRPGDWVDNRNAQHNNSDCESREDPTHGCVQSPRLRD